MPAGQYLDLAIRVLLGVVFATALVSKLRPADFREFVETTGALLPAGLRPRRRPLGIAYLLCEAAIVLLVAVPPAVPAGMALAAGVLLVLAVAISRKERRGGHVLCRCFGAGTAPLGRPHLVRNVVLAGLAVTGLAANTLGPGGDVDSAAAVISAVAGGLFCALLVIRFDDLLSLFAPTPASRHQDPAGSGW
ncbi:hypothetical protein AA958_23010 [Streptomyces sp. CNQ-509]|uniref:MauE/DoxX family redox-associated membrane protein n=1 Tax=Streptomyces sp. CNQ-509 TaxID=444103 RepID=UPI00062DFE75|nr:MauE/DoxX family redox-associated membrane protein [Streptomyces sp. CNQ-509]AKH84594.1 hypothetical protein AA958_23010 [Streptomyces sp. CNQ-509]